MTDNFVAVSVRYEASLASWVCNYCGAPLDSGRVYVRADDNDSYTWEGSWFNRDTRVVHECLESMVFSVLARANR